MSKQPSFEWVDLDVIWADIAKAFAFYGKVIRPLKGERRRSLNRLVSDGYTADELVAAVHGYVRFHEGLEPRKHGDGSTFDPKKWFDPDTVFGPEKLERRVELGEAGPWVYVSAEEKRQAEVKERQEAARRWLAEARSKEAKLRAV